MTIKTGCQCFSCRHKDEPKLVKAYYIGYIEASKQFLDWAKKNNISRGSIANNDLEGLYAQMDWNYKETAAIANELPDIED